MNYQKLIIVGNAVDTAQVRQSKDGKTEFATCRVAVNEGKGKCIYFPVTVFGEYGKSIAPHIQKGCDLLVDGRIAVSTDGRFNVVAEQVQFGRKADKVAAVKK